MSGRTYAITATVSRTDSSGWHRSRTLPTFFLSAAVQGIIGPHHAADIARSIITDVLAIADVPGPIGLDVSAVEVDQ